MSPRQHGLNVSIGLSLKTGRENKKLPQRVAAKKLGITNTYLSALENGRVTASVELIVKAEKLYGKEVLRVE